eukprot:TRINITY_DN17199_c4_g1_i1.p1 TRINITY_DN17199_c4_g1~~TRINITY_DN17199_c4_g1_i1.p1  ORF type:complete len:344 (+),score=119.55 TRINITY_DN17199_c4_g1_i1:106-1032(+)
MGKRKRRSDSHENLIFRELKRARRSDVVRLRANYLSGENQQLVLDYIDTHSSDLKEFKLQGAIGHAGLLRFAPALRASRETLAEVHLKANDLRLPSLQEVVSALALRTNPVLRVLDLSSNPFGDPGFELLAREVQPNTALCALLCKHCCITDAGVRAALPMLESKRRPTPRDERQQHWYLALTGNMIGVKGGDALSGLTRGRSWLSLTLTHQHPRPIAGLSQKADSPAAAAAQPHPGPAAAKAGQPEPAAAQAAAAPGLPLRRRRLLGLVPRKIAGRVRVVPRLGRIGGRRVWKPGQRITVPPGGAAI